MKDETHSGEFLAVFKSLGVAQVAQGILESASVESRLEVVEISVGVPSRV